MAYEDLLKDSSSPLDNKNYFNLTITDLNISTPYPLQFRWKYEDGTFGPWSVVKTIATPGESFPNVPSTLTVANNTPGYLQVTWDGNTSTGAPLTNFDRVDIYINGAPFDSTKAALSFFAAGTKTIVAPAGTYIVSSYAVSKIGTLSAMSTAVTRTVTASVPAADPSVTPSTPTVSSVLGAIQLSWNGKTSSGADQPYGFTAAKVYVGTSSGFTPSSSNQVDVLNFANGQNTLNIGVGTVVNGTPLTYGVDYYIKIATTNGTDTSTAVSATGNPVQIGKVTSGDIVTITADKIATGTLDSASTITVGSTSGKHVKISGTGDPLLIYGTGGVAGGAILSFNGTKLSIVGDGTFSGSLEIGSSNAIFKADPSTGIWLGNATYGSAPFSVSTNGVIKANSGTIGGWTLGSTYLQGSNFEINSSNSTIYVGPTGGQHIRISASGGIATYNGGTQVSGFNLSTNGNLTISGGGTFSGALSAATGTFSGTLSAGDITGSSYTNVSGGTGITISRSGTLDQILFQSGGSTSGVIASGTATGSTGIQITAAGGTSSGFATSSNGSAALFSSSSGGIQGLTIVSGGAAQFSSSVTVFNSNNILLSGSGGSFSANTLTLINSNGTIYANTLGTGSGLAIHQVQSGGNAGYLKVNTSTIRHKENINYIDQAGYLNKVANMSPVLFNYKEGYGDPSRLEIGLIAEDLEELGGFETVLHYNNDNELMGISYDKLSAMLILSIKELKSRLDALEG